ncbi:MAG: phosphodiesterase [Rhizobacter sp.]|nr:phosphodiesterase [Burkholderiales bacterium]
MLKTLLAQLTDLHIREPGRLAYGRLNTAPYLRSAVQAVNALPQRPDALVLTGDLTDFGRAAEYHHLAELLSPLTMPYYLMPGNHDERSQMRRSFAHHEYLGHDEFVQYSVSLGKDDEQNQAQSLRLVVLDTVEPDLPSGRLCAKRLRWFEDTLARHRGQSVVVAMHHPPFETLIGHMDRIGLLEGVDALAEILSAYANVERVICGHLHRTIYASVGGTVVSTAPSPAHQVCLDLASNAVSAWTLEPPGFHLHAWSGPGRMVTHVAAIGEFDGPHPFHGEGRLID